MKEELAYNKNLKTAWPPIISNDVIQHGANDYIQGTSLQEPHASCFCSRKCCNIDMSIVKLSENGDVQKDLHLDLLTVTKEDCQIYFQWPIENLVRIMLA